MNVDLRAEPVDVPRFDVVHLVAAVVVGLVVGLVELGDRLAAVSVPPLTFYGAVLHSEAVVVPPTDPEPLRAVRHAIRQGIEDVRGAGGVSEKADGFRPHVSAAYINMAGDPGPLRKLLDQADGQPVTAEFRQASLIAMHHDRRMCEWTTIATAAIGAADARRLPN